MKVRQPILEQTGSNSVAIVDRIELECELVDPADGEFFRVRLLESGAGLAAGDEITVRFTEVIS